MASACPTATLARGAPPSSRLHEKLQPRRFEARNYVGVGTMAFWIFMAEKTV